MGHGQRYLQFVLRRTLGVSTLGPGSRIASTTNSPPRPFFCARTAGTGRQSSAVETLKVINFRPELDCFCFACVMAIKEVRKYFILYPTTNRTEKFYTSFNLLLAHEVRYEFALAHVLVRNESEYQQIMCRLGHATLFYSRKFCQLFKIAKSTLYLCPAF